MPSRSNIADATIIGALLKDVTRFGVTVQTLTGTTAVPANAGPILAFDPGGGAREVNLPASPKVGQWYLLINCADAAEIITIEDSASTALVPALTPTQAEAALVVYTGATFGWKGVVMIGV